MRWLACMGAAWLYMIKIWPLHSAPLFFPLSRVFMHYYSCIKLIQKTNATKKTREKEKTRIISLNEKEGKKDQLVPWISFEKKERSKIWVSLWNETRHFCSPNIPNYLVDFLPWNISVSFFIKGYVLPNFSCQNIIKRHSPRLDFFSAKESFS